jgi:hypothetical protein
MAKLDIKSIGDLTPDPQNARKPDYKYNLFMVVGYAPKKQI